MGRVDSQAVSEHLITHGIGGNCRENLFFQMGVDLAVFVDSLELPIVVVEGSDFVLVSDDRDLGPCRILSLFANIALWGLRNKSLDFNRLNHLNFSNHTLKLT